LFTTATEEKEEEEEEEEEEDVVEDEAWGTSELSLLRSFLSFSDFNGW
jgi:hypothetical protein